MTEKPEQSPKFQEPLQRRHLSWGTQTLYVDGPHYELRRLELHPQKKLEMESFNKKEKTFYVLSGKGCIQFLDQGQKRQVVINKTQVIHIPRGVAFAFVSLSSLVLLEVAEYSKREGKRVYVDRVDFGRDDRTAGPSVRESEAIRVNLKIEPVSGEMGMSDTALSEIPLDYV